MQERAWYALAGAAAAFVPATFMWGFTVDDALIPLRYAHHLATGAGYRFNALGPVTDGVTPLPWAFLLAPLGRLEPFTALAFVKALGVVLYTAVGAALGPRMRAGALVLALAFPIGAWATSGLETPLAIALASFAALAFERPRRAAALAGLAATFRPELVVWAAALAAGAAIPRRDRLAVPIAVAPFLVVVAVRVAVFGRAAPLAVMAKPSDLAHGLAYAGAGLVFTLLPVLAFAPLAIARADARTRTLAVAFLAHVLVVVAVGGDWMPYSRLLVPVLPTLALVRPPAHRASSILRWAAAIALGLAFAITAAPAGRHVLRDRTALVSGARPLLAGAKVVAALDVGWVSAATSATIVDLAGLTDPAIASLPGGHTSKSVDLAMLLDRGVDAVVLYEPRRQVEHRISRTELFERHFALAGEVALGDVGRYAIYRAR